MLYALLGACDGGPPLPDYTAADLAAEIADHAAWAHPAEWPGVHASCDGAHGAFVQIWQNATADADGSAGRALSAGAIFVAEGYQDSFGTPKMRVAMRKQPDDRWFWGLYGEDGARVDAGDLPTCAGCHRTGTDHVRHAGRTPPVSPVDCTESDTGMAPPP